MSIYFEVKALSGFQAPDGTVKIRKETFNTLPEAVMAIDRFGCDLTSEREAQITQVDPASFVGSSTNRVIVGFASQCKLHLYRAPDQDVLQACHDISLSCYAPGYVDGVYQTRKAVA